MTYDFDRMIDRRGTNAIKYDGPSRGKPEDLLPLWVADMDFEAPPCVLQALQAKVQHGIFGYSEPDEGYFTALENWFAKRFGWQIKREWVVCTPSVVTAIHIAVRALTAPGDAILIQQPVYYPFASAAALTGRELVVNQLLYRDGRYEIDFEDFERKIAQHKVKLFILCNPHNPVGRVWRREELLQMGDICLRHGVTVVADEIHQDFVFPGHRHQVFADLGDTYRENTITCTSPSKTFNLAGLQMSNTVIANESLRRAFEQEYARCGLSQLGIFGIVGCQAAYSEGEAWLNQLIEYLLGNLALVRSFTKEQTPGIKLVEPEGSYLVWLDCRGLHLSDRELDDLIVNKAKLWLDAGTMFGRGGEGFQRINMACPRSVLLQALERLKAALVSK